MECVISPKINYLTVLEMLEKQREACIQKIRMVSFQFYSYLTHIRRQKKRRWFILDWNTSSLVKVANAPKYSCSQFSKQGNLASPSHQPFFSDYSHL